MNEAHKQEAARLAELYGVRPAAAEIILGYGISLGLEMARNTTEFLYQLQGKRQITADKSDLHEVE